MTDNTKDLLKKLNPDAGQTNQVPWEELPKQPQTTPSTPAQAQTFVPQPLDTNDFDAVHKSLMEVANEATTYNSIPDGTYKAITKSLKMKTNRNGNKLIETTYDCWDANKVHQTASSTEWLPEDFLNPQTQNSKTRQNIIIGKLMSFLLKVRPEKKDVVQKYFTQILSEFLVKGTNQDLSTYVQGKEGIITAKTVSSVSKKDGKTYANQNIIFDLKMVSIAPKIDFE